MAKRTAKPQKRQRSRGNRPAEVADAGPSSSVISPANRRLTFGMLLGIICSVAFLLRLINILQTVALPTVVQLMGDSRGYVDWANRIAEGQWYGTETFYQAPLYPYFLAVLIKGLGCGVFGIRFFQVVLGTVSVYFLGIAGRQLFGRKVGLIAAGMYALYAPAIYYDGIIQKTSLASFLLCALIAECVWLYRSKSKGAAAVTGITLGLLVLTRENALLWVPVLPLWIALGLRIPWRDRVWNLVCYGAGLALVLLPVAARNASLGGEWSPTTFQAGPNFYIGNNLQSNGLYQPLVPGHETPKYERADAQRLAEQALGRELSSREVSRFWAERSMEEIKEDPLRWVQLMALKSLMVVNRYEVPDVESMRVYRDFSWPLRLLAPIWNFGLLCPLAVWGLIATRRSWRRLTVFYALTLVMTGAIVLFFILGRYREPLVPLLILFAAGGLPKLVSMIRQRSFREHRLAIIATIAALVVCNLPVHDESTLNASSYMNVGVAAGKNGDIGESIEFLSAAIESHPEMAEAHANLGRALESSNRMELAIECYQNALLIDPRLQPVDLWLAEAFERIGDRPNAAIHYQRALELNPADGAAEQGLRRVRGR